MPGVGSDLTSAPLPTPHPQSGSLQSHQGPGIRLPSNLWAVSCYPTLTIRKKERKKERKKVKWLSHVRLSVTPWTIAHQASPSMEFSMHEYWSGLLFPSSGDLPDSGIEPRSPALQADALPSEPPGNLPAKLHCSPPSFLKHQSILNHPHSLFHPLLPLDVLQLMETALTKFFEIHFASEPPFIKVCPLLASIACLLLVSSDPTNDFFFLSSMRVKTLR